MIIAEIVLCVYFVVMAVGILVCNHYFLVVKPRRARQWDAWRIPNRPDLREYWRKFPREL